MHHRAPCSREQKRWGTASARGAPSWNLICIAASTYKVGSVNALTARAGSTVGVDAQIGLVNLDVDLLGLGKHGDKGSVHDARGGAPKSAPPQRFRELRSGRLARAQRACHGGAARCPRQRPKLPRRQRQQSWRRRHRPSSASNRLFPNQKDLMALRKSSQRCSHPP